MEFMIGALGAVLVLLLLGAGTLLGWKLRGRSRQTAPPPEEEELRRLRAEQEAFRQLTHYSADVAYGTAPTEVIE